MSRNAFRDFWRRRRVRRHFALHGGLFRFHGLEIRLPEGVDVNAANALIRGKYEKEEADLILRHLPRDLPVIELGGSLGVISRLIRSRLGPRAKHIVVEANPTLAQTCLANAERDAAPGATELVTAAVYYEGPVARLAISDEVHASALAAQGRQGKTVELPAVTLAQLYQRLGEPPRFTLVCDIEGAESAVFEREQAVLAKVGVAIVELHPRAYAAEGGSEARLLRFAEDAGLTVAERLADVVLLRRP